MIKKLLVGMDGILMGLMLYMGLGSKINKLNIAKKDILQILLKYQHCPLFEIFTHLLVSHVPVFLLWNLSD